MTSPMTVWRAGRLHVVGLLRPGALPVPVWDTSCARPGACVIHRGARPAPGGGGARSVPDAAGRAFPAVLSPPALAWAMPTAPGPPRDRTHKTLPPRPRPRYNPHSSQASGSVQPVLPGGPASAVVGLFCEGPAG